MSRVLGGLICAVVAPALLAEEAPRCPDCVDTPALGIEAVYTGEVWRQASGGIATGNRYLDNLDLTATADGGRLFGLDGLQLFGYLLYNNGHLFSEQLTGAAQGVTNIEAVETVRLYELWSQWQFGSGGQSIRLGLYDLNSEFDSIESAALFINPSHGIGPDFSQSGQNGPSIFPTTSLAMRVMKSAGPWSVQAAVLDAVPGDPDRADHAGIKLSSEEGALLIGELNYHFESGVRVGGGYWHYTADFDDLYVPDGASEPPQRDDNAGAYVIVESPMLFVRSGERGVNLFARMGAAEARINPVGHYFGAGAVYNGLLAAGRDQLGIALAIAELGEPYRRAQANAGVTTDSREYNYEITYRFTVTPWLTLQSDVQYIRNPGMDPQLDSGWSCGLRFEISRGWER